MHSPKTKIQQVISRFSVIIAGFIWISAASFAAQYSTEPQERNIAPERDYTREAVTFPASTRTKSATVVDTTKENSKPKTKALTNGILPMIVMGAIVLGIFLWLSLNVIKKFFPGGKKLFASPALEVLGRTHFDSQKYLALVRVGTRVVIVGVTPNGFDQISEITDPEEVTEVLSAAKPKTSNGQNLFYKMFQKQVLNHNPAPKPEEKTEQRPLNSDPGADTAVTANIGEPEIIQRQQRIKQIRDLEV